MSRGKKMFIGMVQLGAWSMLGLPKKKLRYTNGRNTTWGVFQAYVGFFWIKVSNDEGQTDSAAR